MKVIHQESGGYGAGVNVRISADDGKYFKAVDSCDWLYETSLQENFSYKMGGEEKVHRPFYIKKYIGVSYS